MKCLILAAGKGSRITQAGDSKPLVPVAGVPLIERTIVAAHRAGLTDFYVVTGHNAQRVEAFLAELSVRRGVAITTLRNPAWEEGNATSLLRARDELDENFVLLMADHIFDEEILRTLIRQPLKDGEIILATDHAVTDDPLVDRDDATRVLVEDDRIVDIGKELADYNAYDTGVFSCSPAIFAATEESLRHDDPSLSGGVRRLAKEGRAGVLDVGGRSWVDVDTPGDRREAESLLYENLAKPEDGLISRAINRKFSTGIFTPLLLKISPRVTANQVSILSFGVSLVASLSFFLHHAVIGGIVVQLASILDGCDGEIARLKRTESRFGSFFDAVLDRYSDGFILFGVFYFSWTASENAALFGQYWTPLLLVTSMLAIFGNLMVSYTSAKSIVDFGYRYRGGWIAAGRGRDFRLFLLFLGGALTWVHPVTAFLAMFGVAVLTNSIVLRRIWVSWNHSRSPRPLMGLRLKAVIFDFDGTIGDTMGFLADVAVGLITENYGISKEDAASRYRETTGMDFASQLERIFPKDSRNREVATAFEARKAQGILDQPIFPEVIPTLMKLERRAVPRFVCSSTRQEIVRECLRINKIDGLLDLSLGLRPDLDKPKQIEFILERYDLDPSRVLFVSDSLLDFEFVRHTGVRFAGIRRIFDEHEFRGRGLFSVQDLTALTQVLEEPTLLRFVESVES